MVEDNLNKIANTIDTTQNTLDTVQKKLWHLMRPVSSKQAILKRKERAAVNLFHAEDLESNEQRANDLAKAKNGQTKQGRKGANSADASKRE